MSCRRVMLCHVCSSVTERAAATLTGGRVIRRLLWADRVPPSASPPPPRSKRPARSGRRRAPAAATQEARGRGAEAASVSAAPRAECSQRIWMGGNVMARGVGSGVCAAYRHRHRFCSARLGLRRAAELLLRWRNLCECRRRLPTCAPPSLSAARATARNYSTTGSRAQLFVSDTSASLAKRGSGGGRRAALPPATPIGRAREGPLTHGEYHRLPAARCQPPANYSITNCSLSSSLLCRATLPGNSCCSPLQPARRSG